MIWFITVKQHSDTNLLEGYVEDSYVWKKSLLMNGIRSSDRCKQCILTSTVKYNDDGCP